MVNSCMIACLNARRNAGRNACENASKNACRNDKMNACINVRRNSCMNLYELTNERIENDVSVSRITSPFFGRIWCLLDVKSC